MLTSIFNLKSLVAVYPFEKSARIQGKWQNEIFKMIESSPEFAFYLFQFAICIFSPCPLPAPVTIATFPSKSTFFLKRLGTVYPCTTLL